MRFQRSYMRKITSIPPLPSEIWLDIIANSGPLFLCYYIPLCIEEVAACRIQRHIRRILCIFKPGDHVNLLFRHYPDRRVQGIVLPSLTCDSESIKQNMLTRSQITVQIVFESNNGTHMSVIPDTQNDEHHKPGTWRHYFFLPHPAVRIRKRKDRIVYYV